VNGHYLGHTVLRAEEKELEPPSWRPEEPVRRVVETLEYS